MFSRRLYLFRLIVILALSLAALYLGGAGVDKLGLDIRNSHTFYELRFESFAGTPFWFLAGLALVVVNGLFYYRWAVIEGAVNAPKKWWWPFGETAHYGLNIPLPEIKLAALNLVLVPAVLFFYILLAAANL